ncbi:unnamed protein product [Allacma fusca]|nr:unnamed protein product [Allacma fusca]
MSAFPGKWKYLTVWDLVLQFAYHTYSLANDFVGSSEIESKKQTKMQKLRDVVFASVIFPTGAFVSITFWGIYSIDRELVFPKFMDAFYPSWLNHAVHTAPIIFLCVEIYNVPKNFPKRSTSIIGNIFFSSTYLGWITWIAYDSGVWAYPILEVLDNVSRAAFLGASAGLLLGLYFVGEKIQRWRWGDKSVGDGTKDEPKLESSGKTKTKSKVK